MKHSASSLLAPLMALFVALVIAAAPTFAAAQTSTGATEPPMPSAQPQSGSDSMSPQELSIVRNAVENTGTAYKRRRTSNGVGNIVGGLLVGGLGAYFYIDGSNRDDPSFQVIGIALGISAVPQIVAGVWNIFYPTPQEDMSDKMLSDDELLEGGGVLFVEQEARRARRGRFVGGTTQIVQGAATLGTYYLYTDVFNIPQNGILLAFFGIAAGLQVVGGVISLVGKSGPERIYDNMMLDLGRDPNEKPKTTNDNRVSKLRWFPTIHADDGKVAPGFGLGTRF